MGPKMAVLRRMGVETLDFGFATFKSTVLRGTASFDVFCVKIGARVSGCSLSQEPPKK